MAVSPSSVAEDGATNLVYTFTRTGVTSGALTVNFSTTGTASAGDYTSSATGSVNFAAGSPTATVTIDPTTDTAVEPDETVILAVTSGSGYNVASPSDATGTITDDDTDVTVAVSPSSVTETGATNLVYTFTRTGVTSGALTVNFSVGGTATTGTDYSQSGAATFTSSNGTVTFAPASTTAIVSVDPTPDALVETSETVTLTVTSGTGYNVGSPDAATGTITDAPMIFTELNTNNAVAIDSVTFVRGPFRIVGDNNFSADHRTRVMLFTSNLGLSQPDSSQLTVQIAGVNLEVEKVGPLTGVPGLDASFIIVKLADNVPTGVDLQLVLTLRGVPSNTALISISP